MVISCYPGHSVFYNLVLYKSFTRVLAALKIETLSYLVNTNVNKLNYLMLLIVRCIFSDLKKIIILSTAYKYEVHIISFIYRLQDEKEVPKSLAYTLQNIVHNLYAHALNCRKACKTFAVASRKLLQTDGYYIVYIAEMHIRQHQLFI